MAQALCQGFKPFCWHELAALGTSFPVSVRGFSFCIVTRRHGSGWEPCDSGRKKLQGGLVGAAEHWAGLGWHWPLHRMAQHGDNLLLAGGRKGERAMGVFSLCLPTWISKMWQSNDKDSPKWQYFYFTSFKGLGGWGVLLFNLQVPVLGCFFYEFPLWLWMVTKFFT